MSSLVRRAVAFVCVTVVVCAFAGPASAQESVTLAWDASPDPEATGYLLSWGTRQGQYTNTADVGNRTTWTVSGLSPHQRYYFIVQAYDSQRTMSEPTVPLDNGGVIVQTGAALDDPRPSLFWRNKVSGELLTWHLAGSTVLDSRWLTITAVSDTGWKIAGTGDLNGDGSTDLVWRHDTTGGLAAWFLVNNWVVQTSFLSIPAVTDSAWRLAGVGDTDGDRRADLVWQHTDGSLAIWFMNGTQVLRTNRLSIPRVTDTGWQIKAVGDVDSDGRADLVWRHSDGSIATWLLNGTAVTATRLFSVSRVADPAWRIAAAGRIDATSPPALVWQHDTGGVAVWYLAGPIVLGTSFLSPPSIFDTNWAIVGAR